MAPVVSTAARGFTVTHSHVGPRTPRTAPNAVAWRTLTRPAGNGRSLVRTMTASMSRSRTMLNTFAAPAVRVPPSSVARISQPPGQPPAARNMGGTVVTSSSSMIRGFVRATKSAILGRAAAGARRAGTIVSGASMSGAAI
jgi:hypothetical protein